ncbi:SDR family NAD(P)-dependent oxidoreductase [Chitinophaga rhizosphaerae]|uniref:SDR family NAD(P)-dependent oxidoreductase n=1 Tax=Chitinophaga rhizosphaerae TaxID=1864947 RepID=UPI000F808309|nr:SDR family NAD(P)-dependent oxidoreductase [Chitinophaga rhizosphaerae]
MTGLRQNRISFSEKVIWITGASSGIGEALAIRLSALGARLILTSRNAEALVEVKARCAGTVAVLPADLSTGEFSVPQSGGTDFAGNDHSSQTGHPGPASGSPPTKNSFSGLAEQAIDIYGRVDILINNAGIGQRASAEETSEAVLRQILGLDFFAPALLTQALLPHFRANGGQVVVTGSMAGLMGVPRRTAYSAAKHALMGYFESLQVEHTVPGFHVTIISPGRVKTSLSLNALRGSGEPHGKMDAAQEKGIPVEVCAMKMISAIARKRKHVIIAREERLLWYLRKWAPPLYHRVARKFGS